MNRHARAISRDVGKGRVDPAIVFDQSQLAHARGVDEHPTTGQQHELAARRRVAAAGIVFPDVAHVLDLATHQPVDQRRLADSRRADEANGGPASYMLAQCVDANPGEGTHLDSRNAQRHRGDGLGQRSKVVDEIDLVEHDDRVCPALPDRGQVALDPPRIEIAVRRGDEAEDVDVGRDHLRGGVRVRRAADHGRPPPQDMMNDGALGVVGHGNPVTDGRAIDTGELVA